jgi:hypothetical protein
MQRPTPMNTVALLIAALGLAATAAPAPTAASSLFAQAPPPARAVGPDYLQKLMEREEAGKRKTRRYYLSLSRIEVAPENASPYQDVVVKTGLLVQGLEPGMCPDAAGVTVARQERSFRVTYPLAPCANPYAFTAPPVELKIGRLEPGTYTFSLHVPNDAGLDPVRSATLTVRPIATDDEAFMIAVTESAADVQQWLARRKFSQDRLDTALNLACGSSGGRNGDDPATVRVLLAAGAQPNAAIHQAAQSGPRCLAALIAAKADVDIDISRVPGSLLTYTNDPSVPRFKVGHEGPPLLYAVRTRNVETARRLLEAGADPNRSFGIGKSPYAEAHMPMLGDDERVREMRMLMEAKGGTRTLAQRVRAAAQMTEGVAKGGGFMAVCLLSVLFGGNCH